MGKLRFLLLCVPSTLFVVVLATCGTLTESGGGFAPSGFEQYARYEHGWPIVFGHRVHYGTPSRLTRFAVFSGKTTYEWGAFATDLLTALLLLLLLLVGFTRVSNFSLRTMLIGMTLLSVPLGQIAWGIATCRREKPARDWLGKVGMYLESEYVGPRWLERIGGTTDPFGLEMFRVNFVRVERPISDIDRFVDNVSRLESLRRVQLWDGTEILTGADFRTRLSCALSTVSAQVGNDAEAAQSSDALDQEQGTKPQAEQPSQRQDEP